jgi:hypothetical protein
MTWQNTGKLQLDVAQIVLLVRNQWIGIKFQQWSSVSREQKIALD